MLLVTIMGLAATLAVLAPVVMARKHRLRWGQKQVSTAAMENGPFRSGPAVARYEARGVPFWIGALSGTAILWAFLTGLGFAPAGIVFTLVGLPISPAVDSIPTGVGALGVVFVSLSGFGLAVSLGRVSKAVIKRDRERVARTATWSLWHHLAVIGSFALVGDAEVFVMAFVPCLVGIAHAIGLHAAARILAQSTELPEPREIDHPNGSVAA